MATDVLIPSAGILYPTFPVPKTVGQRTARNRRNAITYPKGMLWDFARGDFTYDASGRPAECDGYTNWQQWCVFAVTTQRYAYVAVPRWYGVDYDTIQQLSIAEAEAQVIREITEALSVDLRTGGVDRFAFTANADQQYISFRVRPAVPAIGSDFPITIAQA